jgi:polyisoprenoid-binding protein YceI
MAPSGPMTAPALQALLADATLAGTWTLDASKSTIGLKSRSMWGLAPVKGVFREVAGQGTVSTGGEVTGTVTVAAASVDTKNNRRDTHLRSADFFETDKFRDITVHIDRIEPASDGVTVTGTLTVRDQTRPISFPAKVSVFGSGEVWLDADIPVDRADFGLTWAKMGTSTKNVITVHAVFSKS